MNRILPDAPETKSPDLVAENVERLKALFPEAFSEDKIDFEALKGLLGGTIAETEEKYGLNWHGKRRARQIALTPSTGTLRPCPEESVDWDTTKNLMIEGDNLEVLKLLQKSYSGKVKLIYIDPPYNTGHDFVYPDDFRDGIKNYQMLTGQIDTDGRKLTSNPESNGRFHTEWLNMMYPRMKLARNLLSEDGALFVSVDDSEAGNFRLLLDDIFGPENFAASIAWKKRSSPDARDTIGSVHDWILCYVLRSEIIKSAIGKIPLSDARVDSYSNPDEDSRGEWASVDMTGMTGRATKDQYFPVTLPSGRVVEPPKGRSWGIAKATFDELLADNRIWFGKGGDNVPRIKKFLSESDGQVLPSFWDLNDVGSNDEARKEINELMGEADVFSSPKPVRLIRRMLEVGTKKTRPDIVLDFFAGSGTTGQGVMAFNASEQSNLRFILVQLPEQLDPTNKDQRSAAEYCKSLGKKLTIAELTKERLRRAGSELSKHNPLFPSSLGFRVFKLDSTNIRPWNPEAENLETNLLDSIEHLEPNRSEADVLYELLLKLGLDLCVPIEAKEIAGKAVHSVGGGILMACLAEKIGEEDVEALGQGIVGWNAELSPVGDVTCVFRDDAFADDVAKTNLVAILEQAGIKNVRSL